MQTQDSSQLFKWRLLPSFIVTKFSVLHPSSPSLKSYTSLSITRLLVLCFACLIIFKQKGWNPVSGGILGISTILLYAHGSRLVWEAANPTSSHAQLPASKPLSPAIGEDNWVQWQGDGSATSHSWPEPGQNPSRVMRARGRCPQLPMDVLARIPADAQLSAVPSQ